MLIRVCVGWLRYYDTWHTARPSTLPCTLHLPPDERDPLQTRFFCKFRWWRMEEPTAPGWSSLSPPLRLPAADAGGADIAGSAQGAAPRAVRDAGGGGR